MNNILVTHVDICCALLHTSNQLKQLRFVRLISWVFTLCLANAGTTQATLSQPGNLQTYIQVRRGDDTNGMFTEALALVMALGSVMNEIFDTKLTDGIQSNLECVGHDRRPDVVIRSIPQRDRGNYVPCTLEQ
jgi:hypothetical protein